MKIITEILLFLCSCAGFTYGAVIYFKKKTALFNQLIVSALGCMMLGRLYDLVILWATGKSAGGFTLSFFGVFGGFMFLLSASYGQMDGLVDGREKSLRKYRLISLSAPAVILSMLIPVILSGKFLYAPIFAVIAASAYYNLKHFIIPDVDLGILKSIRWYNFSVLLLSVLYSVQTVSEITDCRVIYYISSFFVAALYVAIIPILKGGSRKWTI